jgi:hypothetical protein
MARVRGVKAVRAAIKRAGPEVQEEALKEVRNSTRRMHRDAMARFNLASAYAEFWHGRPGMQNITGNARRLYRWSVSKAQLRGRVGVLSAASMRRVYYLWIFLYGSVNQPARPVHDDAFEAERDVYTANQTRMLRKVLRRVFPS